MKGVIEIDKLSGNIESCTLPETFPEAERAKIADCVTTILQDISVYMRQQQSST